MCMHMHTATYLSLSLYIYIDFNYIRYIAHNEALKFFKWLSNPIRHFVSQRSVCQMTFHDAMMLYSCIYACVTHTSMYAAAFFSHTFVPAYMLGSGRHLEIILQSFKAFMASQTVQPELELELYCFGCPAAVSMSGSYQSAPTHLSRIAWYPFHLPDSPCQKSGTKTIFLLPSRDMFKAFHGSDIYVYTPIGHTHCLSYIAYPLPIDCHRCRYVSKAPTTISYINIDM